MCSRVCQRFQEANSTGHTYCALQQYLLTDKEMMWGVLMQKGERYYLQHVLKLVVLKHIIEQSMLLVRTLQITIKP